MRIQRPVSKRLAVCAGVALSVLVALGAGYAYAAATATNQSYTGCLLSGSISNVAIGAAPFKSCSKPSVQITWSQTGPQGPQGNPGIQGLTGATGKGGTAGTDGTNGTDGTSVTSSSLSSGDANCPDGGSKFTSASGDTYACNGAPGSSGGSGGVSIDQIGCDTGDPEALNGHIVSHKNTLTGELTLQCKSADPVFEVVDGNVTSTQGEGCRGSDGVTRSCYFSVIQEAGGWECTGADLVNSVGFTFSQEACETQRFATNTTIHLSVTLAAAGVAAGYTAVQWTGCDSVSSDVCTLKMTGNETSLDAVTVTAVKPAA